MIIAIRACPCENNSMKEGGGGRRKGTYFDVLVEVNTGWGVVRIPGVREEQMVMCLTERRTEKEKEIWKGRFKE